MPEWPPAAHQQRQEAFGELVGGLIVDHRPHEWRGIVERRADDQPPEQLVELRHQRLVQFLVDDQPSRGGASLARGGEGGLDDDDRCGIKVGRLPHHDRIVAAHLQRQDLLRLVGEGTVERDAGACRSGEQQPVDPVMPGQCAAFVRPADHQADALLRHPRRAIAIDQEGARCRRFLGRFEDHRIAGDQRGDDMAVGQMCREIVRTQHRQHAMRLVPQRHARSHRGVQPPLRGAIGISGYRDVDLRHHRVDFGACLPQRLAGLARDHVGEGVLPLAHDIGETAQRLDPIGQRPRRPGRPAGARDRNFGVDVSYRTTPQLRAGRRFEGNDLAHRSASDISGEKGSRSKAPADTSSAQRRPHRADGVDLCV